VATMTGMRTGSYTKANSAPRNLTADTKAQ
jgi:hypothetical protein